MKVATRKSSLCSFGLYTMVAGLLLARAEPPETNQPSASTTIPYVPTRHDAVRDLLRLADVGTNDVVYDLGSGDGRVVIAAVRDFGARRAVGIEINPRLVQESRELAERAGVTDRVRFILGDLFTNDFSEASVVVLYLGQGANLDLRARFVGTLKPGARIVSHQFGMGEWPADKVLDVRTEVLGMYGESYNEFRTNPDVPAYDSIGSRASHDVLSVWMIPAPVAGVWRGKVVLESDAQDLTVTLHQRLSGLTGEFQLSGTSNVAGIVQADLWGGDVRWHCIPTNRPYGGFLMWFDGAAEKDTMKGTLWISQDRKTREIEWTGRRDPADFTGVWEWSGAFNTPVRLEIERRDGRLAAAYVDTNRTAHGKGPMPIAVTDFYDFGGGFYFTLLLGLEGQSLSHGARSTGPTDGWLIGEALAETNTLRGTIAFYPYRGPTARFPAATESRPADTPAPWENGRRDWRPGKIASRGSQ